MRKKCISWHVHVFNGIVEYQDLYRQPMKLSVKCTHCRIKGFQKSVGYNERLILADKVIFRGATAIKNGVRPN